MIELLFYETKIRETPVALAIDLDYAILFGIRSDWRRGELKCWHEVTIHFGPISISITVFEEI